MTDRFGLSFRSELAPGIFGALDRIDVVEVIADDWFDVPGRQRRALKTLAAQVPVMLHGLALGPASCHALDERRLERLARLVGDVEPAAWSEHLSFVRAGGIEIGHLCAPPRTPQTLDGLAANVRRMRAVVGSSPLLENVATLVDPPGSTLDELQWLCSATACSESELLLDLHNLHANAVNFGFDALAVIRALPVERVGAIHLAGGRRLRCGRLLDDHLHDVPAAVFALLECVGECVARPLDVVLERDGAFPGIARLLDELDAAREALARGRRRGALAAERAA